MIKSELRKLYLEKRNALNPEEVAGMSESIAGRFFAAFDLSTINTLHCFISIPKFNEIDTSIIFEKLWREYPHIRTAVPRVDRNGNQLEHLVYTPKTQLAENSWGIREPGDEEKVDPNEIDLVIVPLLCFDERGHRVGYGKGYYDRFLAKCGKDCQKIGLSHFGPAEVITDAHDDDVLLDRCVTPDTVFTFAC